MASGRKYAVLAALTLSAGCSKETPPRSVSEFMDKPIILEAAVVRCAQNRSESRYDAECINAREAVKLIEAKQEANRRTELEAQSKRKRDALRRTQQAASEARRRVAESKRRREEAAYLAQFGEVLPPQDDSGAVSGNVPTAVIPDAPDSDSNTPANEFEQQPPVPGSNAPTVDIAPEPEPTRDIASIRDELQRRNEENND